MSVLLWVLSAFFPAIPGLAFYLFRKDSAYIRDQSREALNWSITALLLFCAGFALTVIMLGYFVLLTAGVVNLVFCMLGAIAASKGEPYRAPFALRPLR